MSSEATAWCWRQRGMRPQHHHVLLALAEHAHPDGTSAYPSVARIAMMTNYSERSISRILGDLVTEGLAEVELKAGWIKAGKTMPTSYRLPMGRPARAAKLAPPDKMTGEGVPTSTDNLAPEPSTPGTNNVEGTTTADAPRSSAAVDPIKGRAIEITNAWWESHDPRPASGKYAGYRAIVERLIRAGWPPESVARAAADCGRTMTIPAMERALDKRKSRAESYAETDTSGEHRTTVNPDSW